MDSSDTPIETRETADSLTVGEAPSLESLAKSCRSLQTLFNITLLAILVLAGSVYVLLRREVSVVRQQVVELNQFVSSYETTSVPLMREFQTRLFEFAASNPDFREILAKYFNPTNFANPAKVSPAPPPREGQPARLPVLPDQ